MVVITHGMSVPENDNLIVVAADGQYAETDLILCAKATEPTFPVSMFQAQFVRYGSIVYQFNTPEDLGAAIFAIDPDSTLDAVALYKEQVARDAARAAGTLTPENPVPAPDSLLQPTDDASITPADTETPPADVTPPETTSPTSTDPTYYPPQVLGETIVPPPETFASTTPVDPGTMSTTTPSIDVSTTTPQ